MIAVAPDLIETAVGNPPSWSVTAGTSFYVMGYGEEPREMPLPQPRVTRYYLSLDTTKGSGDVLLTGSRSVPSLGVNGRIMGALQLPFLPMPPPDPIISCAAG